MHCSRLFVDKGKRGEKEKNKTKNRHKNELGFTSDRPEYGGVAGGEAEKIREEEDLAGENLIFGGAKNFESINQSMEDHRTFSRLGARGKVTVLCACV